MLFSEVSPEQLWDVPPCTTSALFILGAIYVQGFRRARRTRPRELPTWRCWMFVVALITLFLAIASPLDTYADRLLLAHMTQHFLLMSVVPPLVALSAPVVPLLRGLPRWVNAHGIGPLLRNRTIHFLGSFLRAPAPAWIAMNTAYIGWHVPAAYELALHSERWHNCEHLCFLLTSCLFWWNVLEPWPAAKKLSRWALLPYLLAADLVNTAVSAALCFAGRVVYPSYAHESGIFGLTPLADQVAAGAEMWVLGSFIFLVPAMVLCFCLLSAVPASRRDDLQNAVLSGE